MFDVIAPPTGSGGSGGGTDATSGAGAPSSTPTALGALYYDTTNKEWYRAIGTSSSADWVFDHAIPERSTVSGGAVTVNTLTKTLRDGATYAIRGRCISNSGTDRFFALRLNGSTDDADYSRVGVIYTHIVSGDAKSYLDTGYYAGSIGFLGSSGASSDFIGTITVNGTEAICKILFAGEKTGVEARRVCFRFDDGNPITAVAEAGEAAGILDNDSYVELERVA